MPELERVSFAHGIDTLAWLPGSRIAVSLDGRVAIGGSFGLGRHEGLTLHVFEPGADDMVSVSRQGDGPGETRNGGIVTSVGNTFVLIETSRDAVITYTSVGELLGEQRANLGRGLPLQTYRDSTDLMAPIIESDFSMFPDFVWRQGHGSSGGKRSLIPFTDSLVSDFLARKGSIGVPVYAAGEGRVAIADSRSYVIGLYDGSGRRLSVFSHAPTPVRRDSLELADETRRLRGMLDEPELFPGSWRRIGARLDTLAREALPYFGQNGLQFDDAGRLWVIGRQGEATFVHVYADTTFVGEATLACRKPGKHIALQGQWLALLCETMSESAPFALQLYSIRG